MARHVSPYHRRSIATVAVALLLALTGCGAADTVTTIERLPSAQLTDAPMHVPVENLAVGQVQGTAGPMTDRMHRMLAEYATDDPDGEPPSRAGIVITSSVNDHVLGMVFPADRDQPLRTFVIDDRQRLSGAGSLSLPSTDDPLVRWHASGQTGDTTPSLALVGGWAAPTVMTVALRRGRAWIVAETSAIPGATDRAWAVALDDVAWIAAPFDDVAVYDDRGRLLAAAPAAFEVLPRAAGDLRGGGWRSADIGQRLAAGTNDVTFPYVPSRPVATRTVTITNYGWAVQFALDSRRLHIGAGTRERALADDVSMDVATTVDRLDAQAVVTGVVEPVGTTAVVAAGYAAQHVAAVRILFDDGAWLEVPTRDIAETVPPVPRQVWAVHATHHPSDRARRVAYYEALDRQGHTLARVAGDASG